MKTRLYLFTVVLLMAASAWAGDAEGNDDRISGFWKIKVDDTHYAKAAANLTQWATEISRRTTTSSRLRARMMLVPSA